ncbi:MAG: rhomboid family intramembrane serine protease [Chitinophagaceae bacterium]|nr:rhomboid family intramembrane serine protease [Chitinophagaceae bacterium]MCW5905522.1 rhomboid family intramembrane serine protease [Chitinophagaceae bacterium]
MSTKELHKKSKHPLLGASDNNLVIIVFLNAVIFIVLSFLRLVYAVTIDSAGMAESNFNHQILHWFVLHASLDILWTKPWTILLYMFTHYNIWSLITTLLWLWGFGYILQDLAGNRKMFPIYFYGGIAGAITFLIVTNISAHQPDANFYISGGGASVMAVAVATTTLAPNYKIFPFLNGGIPLWILMAIYAALQFSVMTAGGGSVAFTLLAGALVGFIFIHQLNRGRDLGNWMYKLVDWMNDLFNPEKKYTQQTYFYKTDKEPFKKTPNLTQDRIDTILDKINKNGYENLTAEEKDFLNKASKEDL